jgi:tight adherence protein B
VVALSGAVGVGALLWLLGGPLLGLIGIALTLLGARSYLNDPGRPTASRLRAAASRRSPADNQRAAVRFRPPPGARCCSEPSSRTSPERVRADQLRVASRARPRRLAPSNGRPDAEPDASAGWCRPWRSTARSAANSPRCCRVWLTTIRERQALDRQVRTLTAEGRISAYILTALPILMGLAIALISPDYFEPMSESPGPQILIACVRTARNRLDLDALDDQDGAVEPWT